MGDIRGIRIHGVVRDGILKARTGVIISVRGTVHAVSASLAEFTKYAADLTDMKSGVRKAHSVRASHAIAFVFCVALLYAQAHLPGGVGVASGVLVTDHNVHAEPAPPALPGRWKSFTDPVFHTKIVQLTDSRDGANCAVSYGLWPVFNYGSTRIMIGCDGVPGVGSQTYAYTFDPATAKVLGQTALPVSFVSSDATWSHSDPKVIYNRSGNAIYSYNVVTGTNTLLKDFTGLLTDGPYINRMTQDEADNVFCFTRNTGPPDPEKFPKYFPDGYANVGFACWNKTLDSIVIKEDPSRYGEYFKVHVDKTGRFVWNVRQTAGVGVIQDDVWDLQLGSHDTLVTDGPDFAPAHIAVGHGFGIGNTSYASVDKRRDWLTPHKVTDVSRPGIAWGLDAEFTMLNTDDAFYTVATAESDCPNCTPATTAWPHTNGPFYNEVYSTAADGSGAVRRWAHHHSAALTYDDEAKPSISYDGKFIAFQSNWGNSGRRDVFIIVTDSVSTPLGF